MSNYPAVWSKIVARFICSRTKDKSKLWNVFNCICQTVPTWRLFCQWTRLFGLVTPINCCCRPYSWLVYEAQLVLFLIIFLKGYRNFRIESRKGSSKCTCGKQSRPAAGDFVFVYLVMGHQIMYVAWLADIARDNPFVTALQWLPYGAWLATVHTHPSMIDYRAPVSLLMFSGSPVLSSCCSRLIICDRHDRQSSSSCLGFENHSWMQSVWKTCLHTSARLHATTVLDIWKASRQMLVYDDVFGSALWMKCL